MKHKKKTRGQLRDELRLLREHIAELETSEAEHKKTAEELKRSYAELRKSKDELVHSDKLAFTGRIAANIAHEIRNPLTNVAMAAEQLKEATKPGDPRADDIDIIRKNTERANYLITELLNCARPPKLNTRFTDANKVLKTALESAKAKIELQKVRIVKKFTSKRFKVRMDKEQMKRAFSNLIINAIEAIPRKGIITVTTKLDAGLFEVKIQDTGRGIPEKDIIRIYDPFFSTRPQGVGLGLTLCYGIIVSHGGTIEVESKLRKGSTFTVSLPVGEMHLRKHKRDFVTGKH